MQLAVPETSGEREGGEYCIEVKVPTWQISWQKLMSTNLRVKMAD